MGVKEELTTITVGMSLVSKLELFKTFKMHYMRNLVLKSYIPHKLLLS